jgi:hypothetical protein
MAIDPCPAVPTPVQTGVVRFVAADFKAAYPAFATVADLLLQGDFDVATLFLNNSCCSVVKDAAARERLLYLLTAHVAAILQGANGQPPSGIVGRVDSAREGSVSVSASYAAEMSMSEAYFAQTPWGAMFWQATTPYRMGGYYTPGPSQACAGRLPGVYGPGVPFPFGGGGCC